MNDKKKNPLEGIFAQVTDDNLLRENGLLYAENKQLQSNWNSLSEFVTLKEKPKVFGAKNGKTLELAIDLVFDMVLDKMNELEGKSDD